MERWNLTSAAGSKGIGASDGREEGGRNPPVLEYTEGDLIISQPYKLSRLCQMKILKRETLGYGTMGL